MNRSTLLPTTIPPARPPFKRSALRHRSLLILLPLALTCFALSHTIRAVTPAPDGGYPNQNTAEGDSALKSINLSSPLFGFGNTALGNSALANTTTGFANTAVGANALQANTIGINNTATGIGALTSNTTASDNTATGAGVLGLNTTGSENTATGSSALLENTTGSNNTATGSAALNINTTGANNTATGARALQANTTGSNNTATGVGALTGCSPPNCFGTAGNNNTAAGFNALANNMNGNDNTAEGFQALENSTGSNNIALGSKAGTHLTTGSNNIDIGALGVTGEADTIRIGKVGLQKTAYMQGISGATVASGVTVIVGSNGHLGTVTSSARFKEAIKPMNKASEAILALKPVTFRYKHELDPDSIPQFGLVAEQVEKVNPDLVARDADGKVNTVRYEAVNAMLLNEFLKEHRKVEEQGTTIAQMKRQIETLTATVQKVSDQIEMSRPAPQVVANNR
jgi:hypothetical protein